MSKRVVITTDYLHEADSVAALLREHSLEPVYRLSNGPRNHEEKLALLADAAGAIIASEPITEEMIAAAPELKIIARSGVGYDSVDLDAASAHGVAVTNTPGVNHHAVAELALGLMLSVARQLHSVIPAVKNGGWPRAAGTELHGKTLGVIGYGPSGKALAQLGAALGMNVLVTTSHPDETANVRFAPLEETLAASDYVSLHAKATGTALITAAELSQMKNTAVLINTARGSLINEEALAHAVKEGIIAGAGLDVLAAEPMGAEHPFATEDRILVFSHLGGQTVEARERAGIEAAYSVIEALTGKRPRNQVN